MRKYKKGKGMVLQKNVARSVLVKYQRSSQIFWDAFLGLNFFCMANKHWAPRKDIGLAASLSLKLTIRHSYRP